MLVSHATTLSFADFSRVIDYWLHADPDGAEQSDLDRLERELFETDWSEGRSRLGHEPTVRDLTRSGDQRRADALVESLACGYHNRLRHRRRPPPP